MLTQSARFYDAFYAFKDYEGEAERLPGLIQTHAPGAATVLDVACGTGLHLHFLRSRYTVEGLDLDATLLAFAHRRCPGVPFHQGDMVDFDLGRAFDAVLGLFSAIGYAKTVARMRHAVQAMARHLRPGGVLIVEPWFTPEAFKPGRLGARFVDEPDVKIARINTTTVEGTLSIIDFH
jgi:SAM-dependent methyltransferase